MPTPIPQFRVLEKSTFVDGKQWNYVRLFSPHARDENVENISISFQGGLVKSQLKSQHTSLSLGRDDASWQKRALSQLAMRSIMRASDEDLVRIDGRVVGMRIDGSAYQDMVGESWEIALRNKKAWAAARRGRIRQFSPKSRKRLCELAARLLGGVEGVFITCTYRANMQDYLLSKSHLDKLCRWLRYHYSGVAVVWRMETQPKRGAIHYHLLVFGVQFIDAKKLTKYWQKLTGDDSYPDVKRIRNRRHALSYVSKYIAKTGGKKRIGQVVSCRVAGRCDWRKSLKKWWPRGLRKHGFIHLPYSEKSKYRSSRPAKDLGFIGRFWGIVGRDNLPMADESVYEEKTAVAPYLQFRRAVGKVYPPAVRGRISGLTLFTQALEDWKRYWLYCLDQFSVRDSNKYIYKRYQLEGAWENIGSGYKRILERSDELR